MATNWVKDGLDAYLSLTGEKRAQDKADDDRAVQRQTLLLAQDANQRAAAAAGLSNEQAQLNIDKGKREAEDDAKWDNLLFEEGYKKEVANPFTPTVETIKDPAKVEMSRFVYGNNIKTAAFARESVAAKGSMSIPVAQLPSLAPPHVQDTVKHIFGPAAAKRAGQESIDPTTGQAGVLTGNMGRINLEKGEDGEVYLSADMEVRNADGSIRYAPFTNGTDDPAQPVKRVPLTALEYEATAVIQGIDEALQAGVDPAAAITSKKLKGMENWPRELKKKAYETMLEEEKNLRTRESDVATTKKVGKTLEALAPQIDALEWKTDPHGATAKLYAVLSQSGMTSNEAEKALKIVVSGKVPAAKNLQIEEIGAGGNSVQKVIVGADGKTIPIGKPYQKHQPPSGNGGAKTFSKIEEINELVRNGTPREEAISIVYGRAKQADALTAKYYTILSKKNDEQLDAGKIKSDEEIMAMAVDMANKEKKKNPQPEQEKVDMRAGVEGAKALLRKPSISTGGSSLSNSILGL